MLSCRDVAQQASDHLDITDEPGLKPSMQMRLHLLLCRHCRRFIRHLRASRTLAVQVQQKHQRCEQGERILRQVKRDKPES
ncbi:hypothetical protein [Gilvimarinus agarilyticus]|uniref:hypothetical protein n=1 Tax=Gilvimarinus agarilyticus TaxID=679259 RepID=UPI0005A28D15|nr:hypothetical protein [Gilvimarinus agarilyticus]